MQETGETAGLGLFTDRKEKKKIVDAYSQGYRCGHLVLVVFAVGVFAVVLVPPIYTLWTQPWAGFSCQSRYRYLNIHEYDNNLEEVCEGLHHNAIFNNLQPRYCQPTDILNQNTIFSYITKCLFEPKPKNQTWFAGTHIANRYSGN